MKKNIFSLWSDGINHERCFWSSWLDTKGLAWKDDYEKRVKPQRELDPLIQNILNQGNEIGIADYRVLDVGAGPISILGNYMPGAKLEILAVDPLAYIYAELLEKHNVSPSVRTQFAPAEDLSAFFEPSSFDFVHCRNALDHSFEPMRGIIEMLRVVKVGCTVFLSHHLNEAENEKYVGFHQSNFDVINGQFVIWNKTDRIIVEDQIPIEFEIENTVKDNNITTKIIKQSEFADTDDTFRRDQRLQYIYQQVIGAMSEQRDPPSVSTFQQTRELFHRILSCNKA